MANIKLPDRVLCACTVTGSSGNITPGSVVAGHLTPATVTPAFATNDITYVCVQEVDANGIPNGQWETSKCQYLANGDLQRITILESSNANAAVNFGSGTTKRMFIATPGKRTAPLPQADILTIATLNTLPPLTKTAFNPNTVKLLIGGLLVLPTNLDSANGWFTVNSDGVTLAYITSGTPQRTATLSVSDIVYAFYETLE